MNDLKRLKSPFFFPFHIFEFQVFLFWGALSYFRGYQFCLIRNVVVLIILRFYFIKLQVESSAAKIDECLAYLDPHYNSFRATLR